MLLIRRRKFAHGGRSGLPSRTLCLQRTLLIHFPFLSPFFFPTAYVYVCPADYRKRRIRGCLSPIPGGDSGEVRGSRLSTLTSQYLPPLFSSSPSPYLFSCSQLRTSIPDATSKLYIPGGGRDLRLIPILETLPLRGRSIAPSYILPLSFLFWNP